MTKYQTGTVRTMKRSEIALARKNPRTISAHAQKLMRAQLKETGLFGPAIIYNETVGELLSGHQRLAQLDALERKKDYSVDVTVVQLDATKHAAMLVYLNNQNAQGEYDYGGLAEMLSTDSELGKLAGFDSLDMAAMFPDDSRFGDLYAPAEPPPEVERDEDELEKLREKRKAAKQTARKRDALDFHVVLVAQDGETLQRFLKAAGYGTEERYVSCERVLSLIGEE